MDSTRLPKSAIGSSGRHFALHCSSQAWSFGEILKPHVINAEEGAWVRKNREKRQQCSFQDKSIGKQFSLSFLNPLRYLLLLCPSRGLSTLNTVSCSLIVKGFNKRVFARTLQSALPKNTNLATECKVLEPRIHVCTVQLLGRLEKLMLPCPISLVFG